MRRKPANFYILLDLKGENAALTAEHRRRVFGHECIILDPFKRVTNTPDTFNPLDFIDANDPLALDACLEAAKALVIRLLEERESHFSDAAEMWIAAVLAVVVHFGDRNGVRSLQTVREFISDPRKLENLFSSCMSPMLGTACWLAWVGN